jgi:hypothetical protein
MSKRERPPFRFTGTPNMGVDLWGEVDREVGQSPVRKRDSLRRQYAKCFFVSEVQGEGNCGRAIDRGKEACEM